MRRLTPQEEAKLLSKEELQHMKMDASVAIKWPNGEGPYTYKLRFKSGLPFAVDRWGGAHLISYVGFDEEHVRIMLAS